jgi:hypothetical protein
MPRVSQLFFAVSVLCAIAGMAWGIQMAESTVHDQIPAHAHLNLLGWVGSAIYGTFFALNPGRFRRTAWVVLVLNTVGVVTMTTFLALFYAGGMQPTSPYLMPLQAGVTIVVAGMIVFATAVFRRLFSRQTP